MNLRETWKHLEDETRVTEGPRRLQRRIFPAARRDIFLGLEMPSKKRMLILRVSEDTVEGQPEIPDSRGLVVRLIRRVGENSCVEVELTLTDLARQDIFDLLVQDLITAAEEPQDERIALTRFLARLADWQQLFRRLTHRILSREEQRGLWGELWVVREVFAPAADLNIAVNCWRGPMGADQDFQTEHTCIEVKTSTAATFDRVSISSERQLEMPAEITLLLLGLSLEGRPRHGETLPEIVESTRVSASESGCQHLLDPRLELRGYSEEDAGHYSDIGYSVRSIHPFRVEEGFPKIVSRDLQAGISEVRYTLSTASCGRFEIPFERPAELLEEMV